MHPWALALGAFAIGAPVLIHWLTKPRPIRFPLSTIRFVQLALHQRRARRRLRDILILALRVLAVAALAWAFARPLAGERRLLSSVDDARALRVVILDVSQSMAARDQGIAMFERARARAAEYLNYRNGLRVNLLFAAAKVSPVFERPSKNFAVLREQLARSAAMPQRLDAQGAIAFAAEMLAADGSPIDRDGGAQPELVIVSDFQRENWSAVDFSALPENTRIQLESVAPRLALSNLGIIRVVARERSESGREITIEVTVGNYSETPREALVEVMLGDASVRLSGACAPFAETRLTGAAPLPAGGWQAGRVRLVDAKDALPADDARHFVVDIRPATTLALITAQAADRRPTSSNFLERALAPFDMRPATPAQAHLLRIDSRRLDRESLASADIVVVDHPGLLDEQAIALLAAMVQRGRAMFYVAAEPIDATNLRRFADACGAALRMPVEFIPPSAGEGRRDLVLSNLRVESEIFAVFGDDLAVVTEPLRFAGGLASRKLETGLADEVLAWYSDGSAALLFTSIGSGALAVLNADLSYSNLPGSPAFVPLVGELINRLLARHREMDETPSGETLVTHLPVEVEGAAGLQIVAFDNPEWNLGELVDDRAGVLWKWSAAGPPGVYVVRREAPVFALASTLPKEESDLRGLDLRAEGRRLTGGRKLALRSSADAAENGRRTVDLVRRRLHLPPADGVCHVEVVSNVSGCEEVNAHAARGLNAESVKMRTRAPAIRPSGTWKR